MANKPNINTIDTLSGASVITKQKKIDTSILSTNSKCVLSVTATPCLEKCEREGKFIKLEGVTYIKVIYEDNDGNNCVIDAKNNFAEIVEAGDGVSDFICIGNVNLSDLEFKLANADEIKITAVLNFEIFVYKQNQTNYVECSSEEFCVLPSEVVISKLVGNGKDSFVQTFEVDLGKNISRVIDCYATITPKSVVADNGVVNIECAISNTILYENLEDNMLMNNFSTFDFKKSIVVESCNLDCKALTSVDLMIDKLQVVCEEVEGNMLAHIDYPVNVQYLVLKNEPVQSVLDAYSTTNEISITKTQQGTLQIVDEMSKIEKIDTNITLEDENKTIEKIYSYMCNSVDLTKLIVDGEKVLVEGVAYCNIIYQNFDRETELKSNASIIAEIPFSTMVTAQNVTAQDLLQGRAKATSCQVRIKRSQELDIMAEISLNITALRNSEVSLISDIEIGEEKVPNMKPLNIYVVGKGNTFWDVAKQLSINIEELQKQNAELVLPSENVERVVYYKQLTR